MVHFEELPPGDNTPLGVSPESRGDGDSHGDGNSNEHRAVVIDSPAATVPTDPTEEPSDSSVPLPTDATPASASASDSVHVPPPQGRMNIVPGPGKKHLDLELGKAGAYLDPVDRVVLDLIKEHGEEAAANLVYTMPVDEWPQEFRDEFGDDSEQLKAYFNGFAHGPMKFAQAVDASAAKPAVSSWHQYLELDVANALVSMGMPEPFPVQANLLKHLGERLASKDQKQEGILLRAPYGCGKSTALMAQALSSTLQVIENGGLGLREKYEECASGNAPPGGFSVREDHVSFVTPIAVIVCPTTQLAIQTRDMLKKIAVAGNIFVNIELYHGGRNLDQGYHSTEPGAPNWTYHSQVDIAVCCPGKLMDVLMRGWMRVQNLEYLMLDEGRNLLNPDKWELNHLSSVLELLAPARDRIKAFVACPLSMTRSSLEHIITHVFQPFHENCYKFIVWKNADDSATDLGVMVIDVSLPYYNEDVQGALHAKYPDCRDLYPREAALLWAVYNMQDIHNELMAPHPPGDPHAIIVVPSTRKAQLLEDLLNHALQASEEEPDRVRIVIGAYGKHGIPQDQATENLTEFNNSGTACNISIMTPDIAAAGLNLYPNPLVIIYELDGFGDEGVTVREYVDSILCRSGRVGNRGGSVVLFDPGEDQTHKEMVRDVVESRGQYPPPFLADSAAEQEGGGDNAGGGGVGDGVGGENGGKGGDEQSEVGVDEGGKESGKDGGGGDTEGWSQEEWGTATVDTKAAANDTEGWSQEEWGKAT